MALTKKKYRCSACGRKEIRETNHYGSVYPYCKDCGNITIFKIDEDIPEGARVPEEWKIVKLGDVADIKML